MVGREFVEPNLKLFAKAHFLRVHKGIADDHHAATRPSPPPLRKTGFAVQEAQAVAVLDGPVVVQVRMPHLDVGLVEKAHACNPFARQARLHKGHGRAQVRFRGARDQRCARSQQDHVPEKRRECATKRMRQHACLRLALKGVRIATQASAGCSQAHRAKNSRKVVPPRSRIAMMGQRRRRLIGGPETGRRLGALRLARSRLRSASVIGARDRPAPAYVNYTCRSGYYDLHYLALPCSTPFLPGNRSRRCRTLAWTTA